MTKIQRFTADVQEKTKAYLAAKDATLEAHKREKATLNSFVKAKDKLDAEIKRVNFPTKGK